MTGQPFCIFVRKIYTDIRFLEKRIDSNGILLYNEEENSPKIERISPMFKISAPIMNSSVTPDTRKEYLKQIRRARIERIFLVTCDFGCSPEQETALADALRENIAFFRQNGIEAAIWVGNTIGHGSPLAGVNACEGLPPYSPLVNLAGEVVPGTRCPLDPGFRKALGKHIAALAKTGADLILLDDDFRLSQHGKELCCACDRHMNAIRKYCEETITREELRDVAFHEKSNKYRRAWLRSQRDSLYELATALRNAVDAVDPSVTLACCTSHAVWDIDGTSPLELAKILAGRNQPLIRIPGAPYWATHAGYSLPMVFETARLFSAYSRDGGAERMAEGDVYPRPRYFTPSSHLELFDAVLRADGNCSGILKYLFDYVSECNYETGYLDRHCRMLPVNEEIEALFAGKQCCGVAVPQRPHLSADADLSIGIANQISPAPLAGQFLALNSIPTVYTNTGICTALFGEEARHAASGTWKKGAVLDAISAVILTERGVDVGLKRISGFRKGNISRLSDAGSGASATVWKGDCRLLYAERKEETIPLENAIFNNETVPFAYRYENGDGQRFLVYLFDSAALPKDPNLLRGYLGQEILTAHLEWIARQKLPATSKDNPDLYLMCAQSGENRSLAVGLFNCYADSILTPTVRLDRTYQSIRFVNCSGTLHGDTVSLDRPLSAFEYCAFEVSR